MSEEWKSLSDACQAGAAELVAFGLPESQREAAYRTLWNIAAWQGDREYRRERIDFAEELSRLIYEQARKPPAAR